MLKPVLGKEIVVEAVNEVGVLTNIAKIVAEKGIGILAVSTWVDGVCDVVHLMTDDNLRAADALRRKNYDVRENGVVVAEVPNRPGLLRHVAESLGFEGIDVRYLYATACPDQDKCLIVFASTNNNHAVVTLNKEAGVAAR
jgi:hypothetical protein